MNTVLFFILFFLVSPGFAAAKEKTTTEEMLERRQRVELMSFFLKDPKNAVVPATPMAVLLYNQAVEYFQKNEYDLARATLKDSIAQDRKNVFAYELMGDIDDREEKLADALANYQIAYNLQPTPALKRKMGKLSKESKMEKGFSTYREEHFIIKYHDEETPYEGFELRELLRTTYREISKDFSFYFNNKVTVLLYDEAEFKNISNSPHWVGGLYDGKVRMPASKRGYAERDLEALTAHEVTHAFVAAMSSSQAPPWINEGLAQYEENKIRKLDMLVFDSAIKTRALLPLHQLMRQNLEDMKDPLLVNLFYRQSFQFVNYLIDRYGMFRVKKILGEFAKGKDSEEALHEVLRASPDRIEREWKDTFIK
ncbi:MAG TPA: peptidase MA family metallohydrolase [bacterium]|nr:peptidase MA family metallohydrolase [bacterium]